MMDSFEINKVIGAFLGVVFVVFSVSIVSDAIFSTHAPETPGYAIEVPEDAAGAGDAPVDEGPSIAELLQNADPDAGQSVFRACAACHTVEEGGANRVGPNLWNVINRPIATAEGFNYSSAMREFSQGGSEVWDYEHISKFLQSPRNYVAGTSMAYAGIRNLEQEADLIAYLRTLSNDPAPLPEPPAAGDEAPAEGEEAPAEGEEAPAEDAPAGEEAPAEDAAPATEEAPATDEAPVDEAPAEEAPADEAPATEEEAPADEAPATEDEDAPAEEEAPATEEAPAEEEELPAQQ